MFYCILFLFATLAILFQIEYQAKSKRMVRLPWLFSAAGFLLMAALLLESGGSVKAVDCPAGCQQCRPEAIVCERIDLSNYRLFGSERGIRADVISFRESRNLASEMVECAILIQVQLP